MNLIEACRTDSLLLQNANHSKLQQQWISDFYDHQIFRMSNMPISPIYQKSNPPFSVPETQADSVFLAIS